MMILRWVPLALTLGALSSCALFGRGDGGDVHDIEGMAPSKVSLEEKIEKCRRKPTRECRDDVLRSGLAFYDHAFMDLKLYLLGTAADSRAADDAFLVGDLMIAAASSRESQPSKLADMSMVGAFLAGLKSVFLGEDDEDDRPRNSTVLVTVMEAVRDEVRDRIETKLVPNNRVTLDVYPLDTAFADLREYGIAGTVEGANARNAKLVSMALATAQ